jgi:hypothetical protein
VNSEKVASREFSIQMMKFIKELEDSTKIASTRNPKNPLNRGIVVQMRLGSKELHIKNHQSCHKVEKNNIPR